MSLGLRTVGIATVALLFCIASIVLVGANLSAQQAAVSHEVVSWNDDETVEASVSMVLPAEFGDIDGSATAWVVCGVPALCHKLLVSIEVSETSGVVGSFPIPLRVGDNPLTVTVTAQDANGEKIRHKTQEYVASVPAPQPLGVTFLGYSITGFNDDGTAEGVLRFSVNHVDEWPMHYFGASARCTDGSECKGYLRVRPGWFYDLNPGSARLDYSSHGVYLDVSGLEQGTRELSVAFRDADPNWRGEPRVTRLEGLALSVPIAQSLDVEVLDSEVIGYNDDNTANLSLELLIKHLDEWPMTSIAATFNCVGEVDCEYERVFMPGSTDSSKPWEKIVSVQFEGVPTGDIKLSGTFEAIQEDWTGPQRLTILDEIVSTVPEQPEYDVRWRVDFAEADSYYMDGSGRVNLTLSASNFGYGGKLQDEISAVCMDAEKTDVTQCQQLDPAVELNLDNEGSVVQLPAVRLPQGESTIWIEAGAASGETSVHVLERAVGISRDLWDCFYETEVASGETCGGFSQPVLKWTRKSLNVYRDGDPLYIEIFDDVLKTVSEITGIEYVIVDRVSEAHLEAYVGHRGDPRAISIFGEDCAYGPGCAFHFQYHDSPYELLGARLSVGKRQPEWRDSAITLEEEIRFTTLHETLHALIPVGHDSRPFSPSLVEKPSYIRKSDKQMFRMIYTPGVEPGMSFDEVREFVVFDDETIDYEPVPPSLDLQISKAIRRLFNAGTVNLKITGIDVRGSVKNPGPTLDVQYSGFTGSLSNMVRFWSRSWSSIIFGYDFESWSSAGGRWTMSSDHLGRARGYRNHVKFDFILADPVALLRYRMFSGENLGIVKRGDGTFALRSTPSIDPDVWPKPTVEVVIDAKSGEMRSYTVEWQHEPHSRYRYRIEAEVVSYGEEFQIPDEVREKSEYLRRLEVGATEVEVEVEVISEN